MRRFQGHPHVLRFTPCQPTGYLCLDVLAIQDLTTRMRGRRCATGGLFFLPDVWDQSPIENPGGEGIPFACQVPLLPKKAYNKMKKTLALVLTAVLLSAPAFGQDETELAKKLANPVASLISVPIQANYDSNIGPDEEGSVWRINIQPVAPFALNDNWNLITRTIVPLRNEQKTTCNLLSRTQPSTCSFKPG